MDSAPISSTAAHTLYASGHFLVQMQQTCYQACVVDFQTKDISAMEKECANSCVRKHMAVFNDLKRPMDKQ